MSKPLDNDLIIFSPTGYFSVLFSVFSFQNFYYDMSFFFFFLLLTWIYHIYGCIMIIDFLCVCVFFVFVFSN